MAYERYIKKGGKVYGPYIQHSKKVDGKVVTEYRGKSKKKKSSEKKIPHEKFFLFSLLGVFLFLLLFSFLNFSLTGKVSLDLKSHYTAGEILDGNLRFNLKEGELIPADSKLVLQIGDKTEEHSLSDLVSLDLINGSFFAEGSNLFGEGSGYGLIGYKKIYPEVNFDLRVSGKFVPEESEVSLDGSDASDETETSGEVSETNESGEEVPVETENETSVESSEVTSEENVTSGEEASLENTTVSETPIETPAEVPEEIPASESSETSTTEIVPAESTQETVQGETPSKTPTIDESGATKSDEKAAKKEETAKVKEEKKETKEEKKEEQEQKKEEKTEKDVGVSEDSSNLITGGVVSDNIISGVVSKDNNFEYNIGEANVKVVKGSVMSRGEVLDEDAINVEISDGIAVVSTDYYVEEEGFGEDYSGDGALEFLIDLRVFGLVVGEDSNFNVRLVSDDVVLVEAEKDLSVDGEIANETVLNETLTNKTLANVTIVNESVVNLTDLNVSINTVQYGAVLNMPVKWKKKVKLDKESNVSVKIPKEAKNISVFKVVNEVKEEIEEGNVSKSEEGVIEVVNESAESSNETVVSEGVINESEEVNRTDEVKDVVNETTSEAGVINESVEINRTDEVKDVANESLKEKKKVPARVSGQVTVQIEGPKSFWRRLFDLTGRVVEVQEQTDAKEVIIAENASEYDIEYETPGPTASEKMTSYGKEIVISSDLHYENILSYTAMPEEVPFGVVRLYWDTEENVTLTKNIYEEVCSLNNKTNETVCENVSVMETVCKDVETLVCENVPISHEVCSFNSTTNETSCINETSVEEVCNTTIEQVCDEVPKVEILGYETRNIQKQVDVQEYDLDNNTLVDYIQWVVPHLSSQRYYLYVTNDTFETAWSNGTFYHTRVSDDGESVQLNGSNYFGDGSDGDVAITTDTNLSVTGNIDTYDGDMVVMNYNSLNISSGATLTLNQSARGMLIYVKGDANIDGIISMTGKGAYTPNIVSEVSADGLRLPIHISNETDTLSTANFTGAGAAAEAAVANHLGISGNGKIFTFSRAGAAGGSGLSNDAASGSAGQSGGGGGGGSGDGNTPASGSAGTCFSGGTGGGGHYDLPIGSAGTAYGGAGGDGGGTSYSGGGGAGNPGGTKKNTAEDGGDGTGGLLILIVGGNLTIGDSGIIESNGTDGGDGLTTYAGGGGASGGGNVLVLYAGDLKNDGLITASGGAGGTGYGAYGTGGNGGDGSVQIYKIDKYYTSGNYTSQVFDLVGQGNITDITWEANLSDGGQATNASDVLLLSMDGDDSASDHTLTFNGNPKINASAGSNVSDSAMEFDGVDDYISIPDSSDWDLVGDTTDYTIDLWVKHDDHVGEEIYVSQYEDDNNAWFLEHLHGTGLRFYVDTTGGRIIDFHGGEITDTNWHHVALTKEGTVYKIYKDGLVVNTTTDSDTDTFAGALYIGDWGGGAGAEFAGSLDELRITKGVARWTSNFTPDTSPYEPDTNTTLLLHFDGDESESGHNITFNGDMDANATEYRFDGSYYFDGTGDYISIPDSDDWDFGSDDFTIDFFVYMSSVGTSHEMLGIKTDADNNLFIGFTNAGSYGLYFGWYESGSTYYPENNDWMSTGMSGWSANTWYHVAVIREGDDFKIYRDGVLLKTTTLSRTIPDYTGNLEIGRNDLAQNPIIGHIDELRITKGVARWTQNFDPPVRPYPYNVTHLEMQTRVSNDSATWTNWTPVGGKDDYNVLLIDAEQANGFQTNGTNDTTGRHRMTFNGDANFSTNQAKWGSASMGFDGTGDYISIPDSSDWDFGSDDFTIDFWIYPTSNTADYYALFSLGESNHPIECYSKHTNGIRCYLKNSAGSGLHLFSTTSVTLNLWQHIAIVRNSNNLNLYLNGLKIAELITGDTLQMSSGSTYIGLDSAAAEPFQGYIDELRITKGVARWTGNFTVPTGPYTEPLASGAGSVSASSRYVQYKANFLTESSSYTPYLNYVNLTYGSAGPNVTLNTPIDNNASVDFSSVVFNCSARDADGLANATLYSDYNGTWNAIETKSLTSTDNSTTFTKNIFSDRSDNFVDGSFQWNCLFYNQYGDSAWASSNYTFSSWDRGEYYQTNFNNTGVILNTSANFTVEHAAKFNDDDSAYLSRTNSGASDNKTKGAISMWLKRSKVSGYQRIVWATTDASHYTQWFFDPAGDDQKIYMNNADGSSYVSYTPGTFKDPSGWVHFAFIWDTYQATLTERFKVYIDGVQQDLTGNLPAQGGDFEVFANGVSLRFFADDTPNYFYDGYAAEIVGVDGVVPSINDFGQNDTATGKWIPKKYTGSYGTNGFYLNFTNSTFGIDYSGNGNNFASSGLTASDWVNDTPTNNYATLNSVHANSLLSITEGNTVAKGGSASAENIYATLPIISTPTYLEFEYTIKSDGNYLIPFLAKLDTNLRHLTGAGLPTDYISRSMRYTSSATTAYRSEDTSSIPDGSVAYNSAGDILMVAVDPTDDYKIWFGKNGVWNNGTPGVSGGIPWYTTPKSGVVFGVGFNADPGKTDWTGSVNFGNPSFAISTPESDDNGYGQFEYDPPTGFLALNTQNMNQSAVPKSDKGVYVNTRVGAGHVITANGNVYHNTTDPKFGTSSIYFDGSTAYLTSADSNDWDFGTGDFTIEAWVYVPSSFIGTDGHFVTQWVGGGGQEANRAWEFSLRTSGKIAIEIQFAASSDILESSDTIPTDEWVHIAATRESGTGRVFINGILNGSKDLSGAPNNPGTSLYVGSRSGGVQPINAYMDDVRISKGIARYTANFTPPSRFTERDTNTKLLIQSLDEVNGSTTFNDYTYITDVPFPVDQGALIIIKNRDQADEWKVVDTVRGATNELSFDSDGAQGTDANGITDFLSNGYSLGSGANGYNDNGEGFLDIVLREGEEYGLDILNYTGTGAARNISHNLGAVPTMIWVKDMDTASRGWDVYHSLVASDPETDYGDLSTNDLFRDGDTHWDDDAPTSANFTVGTVSWVNTLDDNYVAYLFADVPGYSKAFSYTGNGNADGPYIPLGFKPKLFFIKRVDVADYWNVYSDSFKAYNPNAQNVFFDLPAAEQTTADGEIDMLSQGIKIRGTQVGLNANAGTYIGFAWAEEPSKPEVVNYYSYGNYTSQVFDAGYNMNWSSIQWNWTDTSDSDLNMTVQARTSNDGSDWTSWSSNLTNPSGPINNSARYFQYKVELWSYDTRYTPLLDLTNISSVLTLTITLNSPEDNMNWTNLTLPFNCSVTGGDIANLSFYLDGVLNETNSSGYDSTDYLWSKILGSSGSHNWTCEGCITGQGCQNATSHYTFTIKLNLTGTVKTGTNVAVDGASVFIVNQSDNSKVANVTTNGTGYWTYGPVDAGTYIVIGYDPANSTLDGDAEPHVVVP